MLLRNEAGLDSQSHGLETREKAVLSAQLISVALASLCFLSFLWGATRFFTRPTGRDSDANILTVLSTLAVAVHLVTLGFFFSFAVATWAVGCLLYVASLGLYWWCVRANSGRPISYAYSGDAPGHLVVVGPYRFVRHPFYSTYMLTWLAGTIASGQPWLLLSVAVMAWAYNRAANFEEAKFAQSDLAERYADYRRTTGKFLPRLVVPKRGYSAG